MASITINYKGNDLEIIGYIERGTPMSDDRINPPTDNTFEIEEILWNGTDVFELLLFCINEIQEIINQKIN